MSIKCKVFRIYEYVVRELSMYLSFVNVCLCSSVLLFSSRFVCCNDASPSLMKLHFVFSTEVLTGTNADDLVNDFPQKIEKSDFFLEPKASPLFYF
jgi:hypothetical protein